MIAGSVHYQSCKYFHRLQMIFYQLCVRQLSKHSEILDMLMQVGGWVTII